MVEKLIIIGSGPAGLTSSIYAARANIAPFLLEGFISGGMPGGQLMTTGVVENFPGFPEGISGQQLMANMKAQAEHFGVRMVMDDVESVDFSKRPFSITTSSDTVYQAHTVIVATGATARRLPLESEARLWGRGISACAVCDGALPVFRNKELAVIGGGDSALEEALHLTQFGSRVYIVHRRDAFRASKIMQERAINHPKITVLWNKTVLEFTGDVFISGLKLRDTGSGEITDLPVNGVFEAIGHLPNSKFLNGQLATDSEGYLVAKPGTTHSSVEGVFIAGDIGDAKYRQAISAAGSGCMAAIECERWLQENELH